MTAQEYTGPTGGRAVVGSDSGVSRERFFDRPLTWREERDVAWFTALSPNEQLREAARLKKERDALEKERDALIRDLMNGVLYTRLTVFRRTYVVRTPKDVPEAQKAHTAAVRAALLKGYQEQADEVEPYNGFAAERLRAYNPGPGWRPQYPAKAGPVSYASEPGKAGRRIAAKYESVTFEEIQD